MAGPVTGLWGFLQSSIMPGPSDALLIPLGLAKPKRAFRLGLWAAAGAVGGALLAYGIGAAAFHLLGPSVLELLGITQAEMDATAARFASHGWIVIVLGLLPLLSSKIIAYTAGVIGYPFWTFALLTLVVRGSRFIITGALLQIGGVKAREWLKKRM